MIRVAALLALLAAAGGWLLYVDGYGSGGAAKTVRWHDLTARVGRVEFLRPASHVYRTRARLEHYLARTMPGRTPALPRIDFGRDEAILVAAGPRSSPAYALRIVSITERRRAITVLLRERTPALGERAPARLAYPFRLLTIPRSSKAVRVELSGRP